MSDEQKEALKGLSDRLSSVTNDWSVYWKTYSNIDTWQFWVMLAFFIVPLITLVFMIDRKKAFRIGFYGLVIHVFAFYSDLYGTTQKLWEYPYTLTPLSQSSFGLDASLIPITYMLLYQWTVNHRKNYYLYIVLLAIVFAFVFKPFLSFIGLFHLEKASYGYLFLFYIAGGFISKWITDLFELAQERT